MREREREREGGREGEREREREREGKGERGKNECSSIRKFPRFLDGCNIFLWLLRLKNNAVNFLF